MSRILTFGESFSPDLSLKEDKAVNTTNMVEVKAYIDKMDSYEKKDYIRFLATKVEQEREALELNIEKFNESNKDLVALGAMFDSSKITELYDEVVIPIIKGTYISFTYEEDQACKKFKKEIITRLTKAYFDEFLKTK